MTDKNPPHDEMELSSDEEPLEHESVDITDAAANEPLEPFEPNEALPVEDVDGSESDDDQSTSLSYGALAFVAFAMLVLGAGGVFVAGSLLAQDQETAAAQIEAESQIAEYDPDEFVSEFTPEELLGEAQPEAEVVEPTPTTVPESVALADESADDEDEDEQAEADEGAPESTVEAGDDLDTTIPLIDPNDTALVFINRVPGDEYGFVGYVNLEGERFITPLPCDRLDWNRNGGVCLQGGSIGIPGRGLLLDEFLRPVRRFGIANPSRAAISPDGGTVSWTGFVTGHDYLAPGEFATTTQLIDVERELGAELETDFQTFADGEEFLEETANYWGTSYIDEQTFYATLGFGAQNNLVFGDVRTGELHVVHENASCPEVSPNGSTIVAKEQRDQAFQLVAIDTATGERRDLAETRSVDDQVEWIDDSRILYGLPNPEAGTTGQPAFDVWVLNVNDGSEPRLLVPFADSPASA